MNATEPRRRRWWPRSVRVRAALAAALTAAVVLAGIGWWVHEEVYDESMATAHEQAAQHLAALVHQVEDGSVPSRRSAAPYEVVATGRSGAVAAGGGMDAFDSGARHVLPAPSDPAGLVLNDDAWGYAYRPLRIPNRSDYDHGGGDAPYLAGRTYTILYLDVRAADLGRDKAAALGVAADAALRVHVVVLPDTAVTMAAATDGTLLRAGLLGVVLIAGVAYVTVRIALRPVEAIRTLTASVDAKDPRERVTVPASGHEIAALATTINTTLQRLDTAAAQQRRFVADAAHELRSPLTTLLTSLEVALAYPERADWPATATTAARQTRRLQALAEDLLLLARLDTRAPEADSGTVDLSALASRLTEQYPLDGRPLTLTCDSSAAVHVRGDHDEFERLLRNLLDNAVRHAGNRIEVTVSGEGDRAVLTVRDDGPGVPPEDAGRIFERFVRLDDARSRDQGGAGLGLAIARDLAQRHGGTLTLAPETPGACFELNLPAAPAPKEE
ncbi:signal transduction histidine kinase [Streptomyces sp. T12]|uniref:sensor histidine kinase n=1 Tax=Streptomyces sp. T12 TaxID=477697 RepID=UPI00119FCD63|nr:HAMP domain-containing sensor histidine kinase [Streptomyces sp. T12]TWD18733.1 signal transduction histidine kinase [Streptomyces sp. T12]